MTKRNSIEYIHEQGYVAEVDVELIDTDEGWSPYFSLQDAYKLDDVRAALNRGDFKSASKQARLFKMEPVAVDDCHLEHRKTA